MIQDLGKREVEKKIKKERKNVEEQGNKETLLTGALASPPIKRIRLTKFQAFFFLFFFFYNRTKLPLVLAVTKLTTKEL